MPQSDKEPQRNHEEEPRRTPRDGAAPALDGVLVVDKPLGMTSFGVVARVRRRAGGVRTGHAGTLDPLATGVLVLALGKATKSIERLMATDKRYRTTVDLSAFTTTDDREGERTEVAVEKLPSADCVTAAVARFVGTIQQRPPAFSAMKVGGRRAYALARSGSPQELPARPVVIHDLTVLRYEWPELELDIRCGKGTYIRSLARDIGESLGTGGHCASLRRTAVGPFNQSLAVTLDALPDELTVDRLIPVERALAMMSAANC
ncbi:MAG: tRNA pseudouridine(55) synthase TruB [Phycisphaerae bacterium]|jgi:tRNA pseudouridine55 synthase|nr:tRNA pseudouridine(55) synthase TruB [Phycisphaerae bacterium]